MHTLIVECKYDSVCPCTRPSNVNSNSSHPCHSIIRDNDMCEDRLGGHCRVTRKGRGWPCSELSPAELAAQWTEIWCQWVPLPLPRCQLLASPKLAILLSQFLPSSHVPITDFLGEPGPYEPLPRHSLACGLSVWRSSVPMATLPPTETPKVF